MILSLTLNPGLTLQHQPNLFHNNTILKFKKKNHWYIWTNKKKSRYVAFCYRYPISDNLNLFKAWEKNNALIFCLPCRCVFYGLKCSGYSKVWNPATDMQEDCLSMESNDVPSVKQSDQEF